MEAEGVPQELHLGPVLLPGLVDKEAK